MPAPPQASGAGHLTNGRPCQLTGPGILRAPRGGRDPGLPRGRGGRSHHPKRGPERRTTEPATGWALDSLIVESLKRARRPRRPRPARTFRTHGLGVGPAPEGSNPAGAVVVRLFGGAVDSPKEFAGARGPRQRPRGSASSERARTGSPERLGWPLCATSERARRHPQALGLDDLRAPAATTASRLLSEGEAVRLPAPQLGGARATQIVGRRS